jgi:U3 small nucleolar RNA-associated protein 10
VVFESEGEQSWVGYNWLCLFDYACRSVFVPYLQYLMNGCVHHLTSGATEVETPKPKKKKKKSADEERKGSLSPSDWLLRQLILSSLHQCFLYDTMGFLDAQKFQVT